MKTKKNKQSEKERARRESDSSSTSSSENSMEWVEEKSAGADSTKLKREEWMDTEFGIATYSREKKDKSHRKGKSVEEELNAQKILKERELNPHWKVSTSGLPVDKDEKVTDLQLASHSVNDGGYSWLKKAYQRVQDQSKTEGRSMEEVAAERWGSLSKLENMLSEAKNRMGGRESDKKPSSSKRSFEFDSREPFQRKYSERSRLSDDNRVSKSSRDSDESYHKRQMFIRPNDDREKFDSREHREKREYSHEAKKEGLKRQYPQETHDSRYGSRKSSHQPSWKKKEFHTEGSKVIKEQQKSTSTEVSKAENLQEKVQSSVQPIVEPEDTDSDSKDEEASLGDDMVLNDNELNYLGARLLAAELYEDQKLQTKLRQAFDTATEIKTALEESSEELPYGEVREHVLRKRIDCYPLPKTLQLLYKKKKLSTTKHVYVGNFKTKGMASGNDSTLQNMFEREKSTTIDDHLKMFVDAASASKASLSEDYDEKISDKLLKKLNNQPSQEKDIQQAISYHKKMDKVFENCSFCLDQPTLLKHTIIGKGLQVFLCTPPWESLVEGHCFIIPMNHVPSTLHLAEDEYAEIQSFKRGLVKMFRDRNSTVMFMEVSINYQKHPHAIIECIPMPNETGDLAPLYFKKAIEESEYEWAHNKKLIDTSKKGFRHSIPKGLPYFNVEFGLNGGFGHVIEDENCFPKHFGKEIVGGMLEIDSHNIVSQKKETAMEVCKKTLKMVNLFWKYKDYFTN